MARLRVYVIYFLAHCEGVTNMFPMCVCVCVLGAAQLINKLNGEDFNEADEQLFEVCTVASPEYMPN